MNKLHLFHPSQLWPNSFDPWRIKELAGDRLWETVKVPTSLIVKRRKIPVAFAGVMAGWALGWLILRFASPILANSDDPGFSALLTLAVLAFLAIATLVATVFRLTLKEQIRLKSNTIEFDQRSFGIHRHDVRRYSEFAGVRHFSVWGSGRTYFPFMSQLHSRRQVIELIHSDADKSVPIFLQHGEWKHRHLLEELAVLTSLPVLEEDGISKYRRPEDVDTSISDLKRSAVDGPRTMSPKDHLERTNVPSSISLENQGGEEKAEHTLQINAWTGRNVPHVLWAVVKNFRFQLPIILLVACLVAFIWYFGPSSGYYRQRPEGYIFMGSIYLICSFAYLLIKARRRATIHIKPGSDGHISIDQGSSIFVPRPPIVLPIKEIEEIHLIERRGQAGLAIISDRETVEILKPLANADYLWLHDYILSKV